MLKFESRWSRELIDSQDCDCVDIIFCVLCVFLLLKGGFVESLYKLQRFIPLANIHNDTYTQHTQSNE